MSNAELIKKCVIEVVWCWDLYIELTNRKLYFCQEEPCKSPVWIDPKRNRPVEKHNQKRLFYFSLALDRLRHATDTAQVL